MSNSTRKRPSGEPTAKPVRAAAKTGKAKAPAAASAAKAQTSVQPPATAKAPARARRPVAKKKRNPGDGKAGSELRNLQALIAETAYLIAEREGFPPGRELEHWLQAEILVLEMLEGD